MTTTVQFSEFSKLFAELRQFVTAQRISVARKNSEDRVKGNEFRRLMLESKQPLLAGFRKFDAITLNGNRPLLRRHLDKAATIFFVAYHAMLLRSVRSSLPPKLAELHASKLVDLDGRGHSVTMEWEQAAFFIRKGYSLTWNDANNAGCEFLATKGAVTVEIECRRFGANAREQLNDSIASSLANCVHLAMMRTGCRGAVFINAQQTTNLDEGAIISSVEASLRANAGDILHAIPSVCDIAIRRSARTNGAEEIAALHEKVPSARAFYRIFPGSRSICIFVTGPRLSATEFVEHVVEQVRKKVNDQLSGAHAGFVIVEIHGISDVSTYRGVFTSACHDIFAQAPHLGGILWRTATEFLDDDVSTFTRSDYYLVRNSTSKYSCARSVVLGDKIITAWQDGGNVGASPLSE